MSSWADWGSATRAPQRSSIRLLESLTVVELLQPVIEWHQRGIVPLGEQICKDPRCTLLAADFFAMALSDGGFYPDTPSRKAHAILLDIDHSPSHWLNTEHGALYSQSGLQKLAAKLRPGGIFGLWSDDPPDSDFMNLLDTVFVSAESHVIAFPNPYTGGESANTVYLARNAADQADDNRAESGTSGRVFDIQTPRQIIAKMPGDIFAIEIFGQR